MEKYKFFLPFVCMGLIGASVVSCDDDDDKDENPGVENNQSNNGSNNSNEEQISGGKVLDKHHYADLGLSVKWAKCNVGALKPEQSGSYFAWGETSPKKKFDWSNYKYCNGSEETLTKYNNSESNGEVDFLSQLEKSDDAAAVNWGGAWRMPTKKECMELIENTNNYWTDNYNNTNVAGYVFLSKDTQYTDTLFMPAAGSYAQSYNFDKNEWGNYWVADGGSSWVEHFNFWNRSVYMNFTDRSGGCTVRAVAD